MIDRNDFSFKRLGTKSGIRSSISSSFSFFLTLTDLLYRCYISLTPKSLMTDTVTVPQNLICIVIH